MLFGVGGSKSKAESQSTEESMSDASSLDIASGVSGSTSLSDSISQGTSISGGQAKSSQSLAFADLFQNLYGQAGGAAQRAAGIPINDKADMLFSAGTGLVDSLGGGPEEGYLADRISGNNPLLDEQIKMLGGDLGEFYNEELLPGIGSHSIAGGTYGGGRQGVAEGVAAGKVAREFTRGATDLRTADVAARDAAARDLMNGRTQRAGTSLGALPGLLGIAQAGQLGELAPYEALAQIMGGPVALTESQSSEFGSSQNSAIAKALSNAFSQDYSYGTSTSTSRSRGQSTSNSKSGSFSIGV